MGLLTECPECKTRNSTRPYKCGECKDCKDVKPCKKPRPCNKCGFALAKFSGPGWWVEYYDQDRRLRRERIGPNKAAAKQRYREVMSARTEGRYIKKDPDAKVTFKELCQWYLGLPEVQAKRSYDRDILNVKHLILHFGNRLLKDITPSLVESYKQKRLSDLAGRARKNTTKPATVNRELACLSDL